MTTQTAEKRRTKASLSGELSDFLIELSAAFQKHAMYPAGHPALRPAANAVFSRLSALLASHGGVSIGVARDQLIIEGVATDATHPLLHALADRLHRHELGAIAFAEGVAPTEIAEVLSLLSAEPERTGRPIGREPEEVLKGRPHVRLHPVRYDSLKLRESTGQGRRDPNVHLWVGLAQAALAAKQEAERVAAEYDPASVARAIEERSGEQAYDQVIIGYMVQIARDLKQADPLEQNELRERFSELISKLQPETLRRLLRMGGDIRQRRAFLDDATQGVAADAVLELVKAAAAEEQSDISRWMMRLLSKMARHAESSDGGSSRYRADEALRDQVKQLLSGWQLDNPNPLDYEQALARISSGAPVARMAAGPAREPEAERIFRMSLEADEATEPLQKALDELVGRGEVKLVLEALDGAPPGRAGANAAVAHCWDRLAEPAVVRRLVAADDPDFELLDRILVRAGIDATDALLDRLASSESLSLRRRTYDRLLALGPGILPAAVERIAQPEAVPWYVLRNVLALLSAFDGVPEGFSAGALRAHGNPQVRYEAVKLCLREPALRDETIFAALSDPVGRIVALAVAAAEAGAPPAAETRLAELALDDGEDPEVRLPAIRALGQLGTESARDALLRLCLPRRRLMRMEPPEPTPVACAALRAAVEAWPDDADVAQVAALARVTGGPEWAAALAADPPAAGRDPGRTP
jgi:hypothetical protein